MENDGWTCEFKNLHSSMERLKVIAFYDSEHQRTHLHSSMERLKAPPQYRDGGHRTNLHSSMERLKARIANRVDCVVVNLHSSMERLKVGDVVNNLHHPFTFTFQYGEIKSPATISW